MLHGDVLHTEWTDNNHVVFAYSMSHLVQRIRPLRHLFTAFIRILAILYPLSPRFQIWSMSLLYGVRFSIYGRSIGRIINIHMV